jgi:predicted small integral membrane protein
MWLARGSDAASFRAAKEFALLGCAIAVIMLFGGFIVIAEIWYELWRSNTLRDLVLESTFRYAGLILLIALFVGANDD